MGWWKCNENGGVNFDEMPTGHQENDLNNAVPGRDTTEDFYNGDGPADIMFIPTAMIKKWFEYIDNKPTTDQIINLFAKNQYDEVFDAIDRKQLDVLIKKTWEQVEKEYLDTWNRLPYPEEKVYVCKFSFGYFEWKIRPIEKIWMENYENGGWL